MIERIYSYQVMTGAELAAWVRDAEYGTEFVVDGVVHLVTEDVDGVREVKRSPRGLSGDYDTGADWAPLDALLTMLTKYAPRQTMRVGR